MNLKPIPNYEGLYSLDLNNNEVYGHKHKKYKQKRLRYKGYYEIKLCKNSKTKNFQLHRLVYQAHYGIIPNKMQVDHIDNNRQNNNIENLRLVTNQQNQWNSKTQKNNLSTGYKNIYKRKNNTYQVRIRINNKMVYCKTFKTLEEAILNRDIKLKEIHGQYANFG